MSVFIHPNEALHNEADQLPLIPACEHFAGNRHMLLKAFSLQSEYGPVFDITCDCEDGAASGEEIQHANMLVEILNSEHNIHHMSGVRIHGREHSAWQQEVDILLSGARENIRYLTIPKANNAEDVEVMIEYIQQACDKYHLKAIPAIHVLIETHGALRDIHQIAAIEPVQVLDFGIMDFISAHQGAIRHDAMYSPAQFEHALIVRAKTEIVSAAVAAGCIPSHNVTLALKDSQKTFDDAYRARHQFGFMRMWSVHPVQIKAIIEAMSASFEQLQLATDILLTAQQNTWAPIRLNDTLYDKASYRYYWQQLQQAHVSGIALPINAQQRFF